MIWKDRVKQYPHRYKLTQVSESIYDFEEVTGEVTEAGTPVNAENLNAMEKEINSKVIKELSINLHAKPPLGGYWTTKTWTGLMSFIGIHIWTDGTNIYYSEGVNQYVFNVGISHWVTKTWTGMTNFYGEFIWTDGINIYYSVGGTNYVLDVATSTWLPKTWTGLTDFGGNRIWTDGINIYYSNSVNHYVLDVATSTWLPKTWTGLTSFIGIHIWTDGTNIYYSNSASQYVLDVATSTWLPKTWTGLTSFDGRYIWTDGINIYYSNGINHYVLDVATSTWLPKTWTGLTDFDGNRIWTDGINIYYSVGVNQYVLIPKKSIRGNFQCDGGDIKDAVTAKTITSVTQLGLTYPCSAIDILNALISQNVWNAEVRICVSSATARVTGLPSNFGLLIIKTPPDLSILRLAVEFTSELGNGTTKRYLGNITRSGDTVIALTFEEFATNRMPLLWSGNFTSGSITVPGISNYKMIQVGVGESNVPFIALRSAYGNAFLGSGNYGEGENTHTIVMSVDGDTVTYVRCDYVRHLPDGTHGGKVTGEPIKRIWGVI